MSRNQELIKLIQITLHNMDNLTPFGPDLENLMQQLLPYHPAIRSVNEARNQFNKHVSGFAVGAERGNMNGFQSIVRTASKAFIATYGAKKLIDHVLPEQNVTKIKLRMRTDLEKFTNDLDLEIEKRKK